MADILLSYWHIILLFFGIAILYSSAGFGGGSSYLAILVFTGLAYTEIRATSLLCNIIVVTGGTYIYYKNGFLNLKKTLPLVLASMPLAFVGGWLNINQAIFYILLGMSLLVAAVLMLISKKNSKERNNNTTSSINRNMIIGSGIGFLSGIVGIGGGIFLAPLLHFTNWDVSKKIAAAASLFILLNSMMGLIGQSLNPDFTLNIPLTTALLISAFLGGQIGSRLSANMFPQLWIKKITAVIIAIVGFRILWNNVF